MNKKRTNGLILHRYMFDSKTIDMLEDKTFSDYSEDLLSELDDRIHACSIYLEVRMITESNIGDSYR